MNDDVKWVRLTYPDSSQRIIRATKCIDLVLQISGELEDRDVYCSDGSGVLKHNFLFDVQYKRFIDIEGLKVEEFDSKPKYEREVDKFASRFI